MLRHMKAFKLTEKPKSDLEERHRLTKDATECDRIKAVLLHSEDWTYLQIAQALRIHKNTVKRHIKDYLSGQFKKKVVGLKAY